MNRAGYLTWRTALKNRQAKLVEEICRSVGVVEEECRLVAALVRKEGLGRVSSIPPHSSSAAAADTTAATSNTATTTTTNNNNSAINDHHPIRSQDEGEGDGGGDIGNGSSHPHPDVQILEDVACLVFLDDQFEEFEKRFVMGAPTRAKDEQNEQGNEDDQQQQQQQREEKVIGILKKTWAKMSPRGHELALQIHMSDRTKNLVMKALEHAN